MKSTSGSTVSQVNNSQSEAFFGPECPFSDHNDYDRIENQFLGSEQV